MPRRRKKTTQPARIHEPFSELAEILGGAMAAVVEHPDCCEYLRERLSELHSGLMSEFACDVADDMRLRFAMGAMKACEGRRPA